MYLLDTNVISACAPAKSDRSPDLVRWIGDNTASLYLSVVTVAEIEDGIAKLRRSLAAGRSDRLAEWLGTMLHLYGDRFLAIDVPVARRLGALSDAARKRGHAPGFADLAIAATAQVHGHTILTRNLRHFQMLEVAVCNPFDGLPR